MTTPKRAIDEGEELISGAMTYAILEGENPIRVWPEYRGLTQQELAEATGISIPWLSQIETGKCTGTTEVLAAIAQALGLSLDDVVAPELA
jgi:transcriptional regulator with XRE-family HTH domain